MTVAAPAAPCIDHLSLFNFDYDLPSALIAQRPIPDRDASRLLVVDRQTGAIHHSAFHRLVEWLAPGDLLVANNSRVIPARLLGRRTDTGGAVEVLLLRCQDGTWSALARPAKRLKPGIRLKFAPRTPGFPLAMAVVVENVGEGEICIQFENEVDRHLSHYGQPPLPPYITEPLQDEERYQTVFGSIPGSAAAPTAGLHFTERLLAELRDAEIGWGEVTLHIGLDTFRPVTAESIADHHIHQEWCEVTAATAEAIASCRDRGSRVVAIGTTAARTLETLGRRWRVETPAAWSGFTDLYILPGHEWRIVDALVTNFHLPRSTLLMLVSALAGRETILDAYAEAVREGYRFYSFGDAMLIH